MSSCNSRPATRHCFRIDYQTIRYKCYMFAGYFKLFISPSTPVNNEHVTRRYLKIRKKLCISYFKFWTRACFEHRVLPLDARHTWIWLLVAEKYSQTLKCNILLQAGPENRLVRGTIIYVILTFLLVWKCIPTIIKH